MLQNKRFLLEWKLIDKTIWLLFNEINQAEASWNKIFLTKRYFHVRIYIWLVLFDIWKFIFKLMIISFRQIYPKVTSLCFPFKPKNIRAVDEASLRRHKLLRFASSASKLILFEFYTISATLSEGWHAIESGRLYMHAREFMCIMCV
jgi:hypothetical protein